MTSFAGNPASAYLVYWEILKTDYSDPKATLTFVILFCLFLLLSGYWKMNRSEQVGVARIHIQCLESLSIEVLINSDL